MKSDRIKVKGTGSGVYLLKLKAEVVYVGQSHSVLSRLGGHRSKLYDEVEILWCSDEEMVLLEKDMIKKYKPKLNKVVYRMLNKNKNKDPRSSIRYNRLGIAMIASTIYLPRGTMQKIEKEAAERTILEGRYVSKSAIMVDAIKKEYPA